MFKIDILFQTKTAKKTIPFGAAHTYIAYMRDYPLPPPPLEFVYELVSSLLAR